MSYLWSVFPSVNCGRNKLTLSGFGRIAPEGVDTAVRIGVVLDMFGDFMAELRLINAVFLAESRSESRSALVAIFFSSVWDGRGRTRMIYIMGVTPTVIVNKKRKK